MADINISKYTTQVLRVGSTPSSPGFAVNEGQDPVDPSGNPQTHLPVTIAAAANSLSITESQVLSGAGTVAQYIRGDGSLADFPESSGGGSSVSYYLNGSVSQGTIGGVAYKELNKVPILGAGTDFTIAADGYISSFITDSGDPNLLEIPGGNWNFESYFSASSGGGSPTFYVELYKVNAAGTATLIASSSAIPELIAFGTNITPYFSSLAVPTTVLALTDRLAVRYYVTHSGRTITLHTEGAHLCQIITTFTTGLTALNGLTAQVQFFAVGTSGTDFAIASATATHTFNLPTASATNRGALSSADWTTFNNKTSNVGTVTSVAATAGTGISVSGSPITTSGTLTITNTAPDQVVALTASTGISVSGTYPNFTITNTSPSSGGTVTSVGLSSATSGVTIGSTPITTSGTITLAIATASGSQNGLLSSTDWTTFNSKQGTITLTTTGTSGAATFSSNTLNIPNYGSALSGYLPLSAGISFPLTGDLYIRKADGFQNLIIQPTTTTNAAGTRFLNSGNDMYMFIDNSGGDYGPTGANGASFAYNANIRVVGNRAFNIATNDTVRLTIAAGGNLLVGTTTDAGYKLDVNGTGRFKSFLYLGESLVENGVINSPEGIYINADSDASGGSNDIVFGKGRTSTSGGTTLMTIKNGGNVLIGNTTSASTTSPINISLGGTYGTTLANGTKIKLFDNGTVAHGIGVIAGNLYLNTNDAATEITLNTNNTERMRITSGGQLLLGISSTSETTKLFVKQSQDLDYRGISVESAAAGGFFGSMSIDANGNLSFAHSYTSGSGSYRDIRFLTSNVERMRITSGGNLGIGTTTPGSQVAIEKSSNSGSGSGFPRLAIKNTLATQGDGSSTFNFADILLSSGNESVNMFLATTFAAGTWAPAAIINVSTNHDLQIKTNNTERMRITSGGNVLIGTTTNNGANLRVNGTGPDLGVGINVPNIFVSGASGFQSIGFRRDADTNGGWFIGTSHSVVGDFGIYQNQGASAPVNRLSISTSGGNVGIGTASPTDKLHINGGSSTTFLKLTGQSRNMYIGQNLLGLDITQEANADMVFATNATYRMRINASGNVWIGSLGTDTGDKLRVVGTTFTNEIMTYNPQNDNRSGVNWRLGAASIGTDTLNRRLRVNVGGVEYYIGAVEV